MSPNEDIKTFYILYGDGPNTGLGRSFSPRKESHETINLILLKTTHDALYSHGYTAKLHSESSSGLGRTSTCPPCNSTYSILSILVQSPIVCSIYSRLLLLLVCGIHEASVWLLLYQLSTGAARSPLWRGSRR